MTQWNMPRGMASNFCTDILEQPHTLIAGTTGSGKSSLMNAIIYTALYRSPLQCRFILLDTKQTELYDYRALPHTLIYSDDPSDALMVLNTTLDEIQTRNQRARAQGLKRSKEPDIYVFIDELGDLIFSNRDAVTILGRIAMIGRTANVHIIAGTQCPNRKTLSPEFAANCPARVGLRCGDKIESRQIIGNPDAVGLPLYGLCYYRSPQYLTPQLVKVPYYTAAELAARVRWWIEQKDDLPVKHQEPTPASRPRWWWQR